MASLAPSSSSLSAYFPKSDGYCAFLDYDTLRSWPDKVGPIFDPDHVEAPIDKYNEDTAKAVYPERKPGQHGDLPPATPQVHDDYLYPSLSKNERLRLTMMWYHTRDVKEDKEFLLRLQEKLDLVQTFLGWEFAIIGLLSEDVFTRLVTCGMPLAILPRRESTCSHTVTQAPGTVFMLPDMSDDWRFQNSGHVEEGGLRSYAGTQLRCKTDNGVEIAIGSLCIASRTPQEPLPPSQQAALVRFADMLTAELIARTRERRKQKRHEMAEQLAKAAIQADVDSVETLVINMIRRQYPSADVSIQEAFTPTVTMPDRTPISYFDVVDGLWEDAEYLDKIIETENYHQLQAAQSVRAIVHLCRTHPVQKYLVVASRDVQYVFDDVDSWFVERCSLFYSNTIQEARLKEALKAKELFLRGVTHQLRTPIHGILGAVELLSEEVSDDRNLIGEVYKATEYQANGRPRLRADVVLNTIRDSGRELMSTVNNMIKLNRWTGSGGTPAPFTVQSLNHVETDILYEVAQTMAEKDIAKITILFENQLAAEDLMIVLDLVLLKECLQAIVLNGLQYTTEGSVIITISGSKDHSRLVFDVVDTGCGIPVADQARIFEAYEKADIHTRGAGLGLTLASKIALTMDGQVSLVESTEGRGSHFRAEFFGPGFACPRERRTSLSGRFEAIPKAFYVLPARPQRSDLVASFARYLEHRGFADATTSKESMVILQYTSNADEYRRQVESMDPSQVAMCLVPAGELRHAVDDKHEVHFFHGPFHSTRLEEILNELDSIYQRLQIDHNASDAAIGTASKTLSFRPADCTRKNAASVAEEHPRALLVDDNIVNLRIMRMYCEKRHITYTTAADGLEAIAAFEQSIADKVPANLILMDLQMPHCDGADATRRIRELERAEARPPSVVFMVTGQDSEIDRVRSFEAGADEFYPKPMSLKTLDRGVARYFRGFKGPIVVVKK